MTEQQLRKKVVSIMEGWVGLNEADGSHRKILDIYNAHKPLARGYAVPYDKPWCAATVSAAFIHAGLASIAPIECSCSRMIDLSKERGRWMENDAYKPEVGDLVIYDWDDTGKGDCTGGPEHVGIVAKVVGNTIKVIEGNYKNAVGYRSLQVNGRYIRGYCLPDYASKVSDKRNPVETIKVDPAKGGPYKLYAKKWTVTASALNMRRGAGTTKAVIKSLKKGEQVTCYGYYTQIGATTWLFVVDKDGVRGFCSKKYLK